MDDSDKRQAERFEKRRSVMHGRVIKGRIRGRMEGHMEGRMEGRMEG